MAYKAAREDVWAGEIKDRPGALNEKLAALADAGANLEFGIARRVDKKAKTGVVFVTPIKGAAEARAARKAGLQKAKGLFSICIEGKNKKGVAAELTGALAEAKINLRGFSAASIGRQFVMHLSFDKSSDATKAIRLIKKL